MFHSTQRRKSGRTRVHTIECVPVNAVTLPHAAKWILNTKCTPLKGASLSFRVYLYFILFLILIFILLTVRTRDTAVSTISIIVTVFTFLQVVLVIKPIFIKTEDMGISPATWIPYLGVLLVILKTDLIME